MAKALLAIFLVLATAGTLIPAFPATWITAIGLAAFGFLTGFKAIPLPWMLFGVGMMILAEGLEYIVGAAGAKRFGASRPGIVGAVVGEIVGVMTLGPLGIIVGPIAGAALMELIYKRPPADAVRAGVGATIGVISGILMKFLLVLLTTVVIITRIF